MNVKDIMTPDPIYCVPDTNLKEVAQMMLEHDCGEVPVVNTRTHMTPVGVITDRDIVVRTIAQGENPLEKTAGECMSQPCIMVSPETTVEECCDIFERNQIRRVPVIDHYDRLCGIVSQADIATHDLKEELVEVLEVVSQPVKCVS